MNGKSVIQIINFGSHFSVVTGDSTQYNTATLYFVSEPSSSLGFGSDSYEFVWGQALFSEVGPDSGGSVNAYDIGNADRRASLTGIQTQDVWHYRSIHLAGNQNTSARVYDHGVAATMTGGNGTALNAKLTVDLLNAYGDYYDGHGLWHGRVAEYMMYNIDHDDATRALVEAFLTSKWGL